MKNISQFLFPANSKIQIIAKFESGGKFRRESNVNLLYKKTIHDLDQKKVENYVDGIIFGIIFGTAFFNLFLCLSLRDITYFWYTLYLFLFALTYITFFLDEPPKLTQFITTSLPEIAFYIKKFGDPLVWLTFAQFSRSFLHSKIKHPRWDKVLLLLMLLIAVQFLVNALNFYHFTGYARTVIWHLTSLTTVILACISLSKGYKPALYFMLGQFLVQLDTLLQRHFTPKLICFGFFQTPIFSIIS